MAKAKRIPYWTVTQHFEYEARVTKQLLHIQQSIDNVMEKILLVENIQVNGAKGVQQILQSLDSDVKSLKREEQGHWWNRPIKYFFSTKSVVSKMLWLILAYIVISSVLHAWGVDFNIDGFTRLFK